MGGEFNWQIGTLPKGWRLDDTAKITNGDYKHGRMTIYYTKNLFAERDDSVLAETLHWQCDEHGYAPSHVVAWLRWFASLPKPGDE